jgi:ubiquitin-large subunit ribosomal protein L40e
MTLVLLLLFSLRSLCLSALSSSPRFSSHLPLPSLLRPLSYEPLSLVHIRGGMQVTVKTMSGNSLSVDVSPNESIESLKQKIEQKEGFGILSAATALSSSLLTFPCVGIPPDQQRLVFGGRQLEGSKTISDYKIEDAATLNLVLRLRGGCQRALGLVPWSLLSKLKSR